MPPSANASLPEPLSAFIGREHEIAEIRNLLSEHRLVMLTGAGGSGKTRLAIRVANELSGEYEDGVWFIELASLAEPALVPQTIASTLNVHESSARPLMDSLVDYLSTRELLLVVDNCEHLISNCAKIVEILLQKCPHLSFLATSREPLNIASEVVWSVPPLSLPDVQPWRDTASGQKAISVYEQSEAIQLFVSRARSAAVDFSLTLENGASIAEICRRLDGIPLAIELAAARVRSLSVQQIAQRLDDCFQLLTGGTRTAPPRQQTLAATLDWSYNLLSESEQKLLQRLSVFTGGAALEAVEAVCAGEPIESTEVLDVLSHLVNKSLVTARRLGSGEMRYHLLETIRQYGLEKLTESGDLEVAKNRHLDYFIGWAEKAEPHLDQHEQLEWLEVYETEHGNLRIALDWCSAKTEVHGEAGLRLATACGRFWRLHSYLSEGRLRLSNALAQSDSQGRTITRARALTLLANIIYLQSDYPAMRPVAEEALSLWRELGEPGRTGTAHILDLLGELATEEGDYVRAPELFRESLVIYKELNDLRGISGIYMQLGWVAMRTGDLENAKIYLEEFRRLSQQIGDKVHLSFAYSGLGEVEVRQGAYDRAIPLLEESLELNRERKDKWGIGTSLGSLGWIALCQRDFKQMRKLLGESLAVRIEVGDQGGIAWCLEKLAQAKYDEGQLENATRIFGHAEDVRVPIRSVIDPADQPGYKRLISDLQSALGPDAFAALWAEGATMPLEEIIKIALAGSESQSSPSEKAKFGGLTAREREVAMLIAQGKSNREIADKMTVGVKTVETYVTRILNKLGFDSRVQIATWAVEKGLK